MAKNKTVVVGITGGIACGKSEVGKQFEDEGFAVCDTDEIARRHLQPGHLVFDRVVKEFGAEMLDKQGRMDRKKLARAVFSDEQQRNALNAIMHPPIMEEVRRWIERMKSDGKPSAVIVPLLFEIGATKMWEVIVCVASDRKWMVERLKARGLSDEEAQQRVAAQWPLEDKIKKANYVIYNNGTLEDLKKETSVVCSTILGKECNYHV